MNHGVPNLSQNPIIAALPLQCLQFFLYFLIFLRSHWDFFDESQQLSDSIVDALADLSLDYFSQPLKNQRAIKRQNSATITTTNDVFRNTSPAFPLIAELSAILIIPFSGCKRKDKPVLKEVRFSKTAVFGPQRPRVAFDRLGSSLTPNP